MERKSGILLHITSLPMGLGVGDLGPGAYRFVDFLQQSGQRLWQILPLNPTDPGHGNSPYHSHSSFAFNPLLISPELLARQGLIKPEELPDQGEFPPGRAAYRRAGELKRGLFRKAWERFCSLGPDEGFERFCSEEAYWLDDFALFTALKSRFKGRPWDDWPGELRDRERGALASAWKEAAEEVDEVRFLQYVFSNQWKELRAYCKERGVDIVGDVPIYVVHDSADVWVHPELFKLDQRRRP
ncbi:MAG: 4-alpha-glucanotransferase, partial [Desulfobacteraceae bacterium]